jgi:microcystin-dependent protein
MAPSAVNDSARAMMASVAKWRDDNAGKLITAGTSTSYTLTTNTGFFSKATMDGAEIAVTIHTTNGANPTLNVDGLGADPIIIDTVSSTTPVPSATLLTGGVYTLVYYNSGNTWRLKDFYQLPFTVPVGGMIDYFGTTAPSSNFVLPYGQAISRTTYATLFSLFSTTFGAGDGSTTFNIPDLRGRTVAGKDDMGGSALGLIGTVATDNGTIVGTTLGSKGGTTKHAIVSGEIPSLTATQNGLAVSVGSGGRFIPTVGANMSSVAVASGAVVSAPVSGSPDWNGVQSLTGSINISATYTNGSQTQIALMQPTIIANKLLRII